MCCWQQTNYAPRCVPILTSRTIKHHFKFESMGWCLIQLLSFSVHQNQVAHCCGNAVSNTNCGNVEEWAVTEENNAILCTHLCRHRAVGRTSSCKHHYVPEPCFTRHSYKKHSLLCCCCCCCCCRQQHLFYFSCHATHSSHDRSIPFVVNVWFAL